MSASRLFGPSSTTAAMEAAVSDEAWMAALLRFERELAAAEAGLGLIPAAAAQAIATATMETRFDYETLGVQAVASGTPVLPMLSALRVMLTPDVGRHLHHGATSQDALDSAAMLVSRDALTLLIEELSEVAADCAALAERHIGSVMIGRTLLRQARPTTFRLKAASWLDGVLAARRVLLRLRDERMAVQLGGAAGSLDVLGPAGLDVAEELGRRLGLLVPALPWHGERSRIGEIAGGLAMTGAATAKIALDVILLSQSEVAEVREGQAGPSSAMPEKRNPARAVQARAAYEGLLGQVQVLLGSLVGEQERAAGAWQAEWPALSAAFRLAAGVATRTRESLHKLEVDIEQMRRNAGQAAPPGAAADFVSRALDGYRKEETR